MKNAQTGLKSSRPLDRADYLETGRSWALRFGTTHARKIAVKKTRMPGRGINQKICDFRTALM